MDRQKVIVVEGKADRFRLKRILAEPVQIICTFGTISEYHLDELMEPYEASELFVFVDADDTGDKIRTLFKKNYPWAIHLYTDEFYKEVETTPYDILAEQLDGYFNIHREFLL
ncbi:toprim domain-containing protein [Sporosarcina pasteurii]|uniref:Ribonuclease M5 n=1 Tax=Sporosarcina pasteurii TaxID=1474 RepID=A0A380CAF1_SPOPA|nr:toprim domain-containing protein [Sporosarcina pasteurii]MDS9472749.1 hypothetical protein [Sporosarcina pasteurii]QBQ04401.1 hypothetical protein E2C16_01185 [Sporosarcina pasteurii]SUJ15383.1 ribonuclease M5 [Sporosarcina pasteurii]